MYGMNSIETVVVTFPRFKYIDINKNTNHQKMHKESFIIKGSKPLGVCYD
jgi:hypothetical protein